MTIWNYGVSWSKLQYALSCQKALQYAIHKTPPSRQRPNYYMELGITAQYIFEQYFNQGVNLRPGGVEEKIWDRVVDRVLDSDWFKKREITYPYTMGIEDFKKTLRQQVKSGFSHLKTMGILGKKLQSEVIWNAVFRGMRTFAKMDFLEHLSGSEVGIYDGKGYQQKNADPDQLLYYALTLAASGKKVVKGGFIYWTHGFDPVDMSPPAIKKFVDGKLATVLPIFQKLSKGTTDLPPDPEPGKCFMCNWREICPESMHRRKEVLEAGVTEVGFGEVGYEGKSDGAQA